MAAILARAHCCMVLDGVPRNPTVRHLSHAIRGIQPMATLLASANRSSVCDGVLLHLTVRDLT